MGFIGALRTAVGEFASSHFTSYLHGMTLHVFESEFRRILLILPSTNVSFSTEEGKALGSGVWGP